MSCALPLASRFRFYRGLPLLSFQHPVVPVQNQVQHIFSVAHVAVGLAVQRPAGRRELQRAGVFQQVDFLLVEGEVHQQILPSAEKQHILGDPLRYRLNGEGPYSSNIFAFSPVFSKLSAGCLPVFPFELTHLRCRVFLYIICWLKGFVYYRSQFPRLIILNLCVNVHSHLAVFVACKILYRFWINAFMNQVGDIGVPEKVRCHVKIQGMERKGDKEDENKRQKQQKESSAAAL